MTWLKDNLSNCDRFTAALNQNSGEVALILHLETHSGFISLDIGEDITGNELIAFFLVPMSDLTLFFQY